MIGMEDDYDLCVFGWKKYLGFRFLDLELATSLCELTSFEWIVIEVYESFFVV